MNYDLIIGIALYGTLLAAVLLYGWLPGRRAMLVVMLGSTMFLPNSGYQVPLLRQYDKFTAASLSVLLALLLFDIRRVTRFRFHWIDIPMGLWCICPLISSLTNDLGVYDGLAESELQFLQWGLPYFIGRLYFGEAGSLGELARALFKAGLILIPFCLVEIAKGPLFHAKLYGFYPHNYWEQYRYNGWRPSVFFVHGLWLGWFMTVATIAGLFIWRAGRPAKVFKLPVLVMVGALVVVTVMCKSTGALVILALGLLVLPAGRYRKLVLALLIVSPIIYVGLRVSQSWNGDIMVNVMDSQLGTDRANSLSWRLMLEDKIIAHASPFIWFGLGGWNRSLAGTDAWTEAVWTQELGRHGLFGVASFLLSILLPPGVCWWRFRTRLGRLDATTAMPIMMMTLCPLLAIYYLTVLDFSCYNYVMVGAMAVAAISPQAALPTLVGARQRRVARYSPPAPRPGQPNLRPADPAIPVGRSTPHAG